MPIADRAHDPVGVVGYAYPWDVLGDPEFVTRVKDLGITRIALAAAYHTTRAATPLHPDRRLVDAKHAALYRPIRDEAWAGRRLVPAPASWVADDDPFGSASAALTAAGIDVAPWIVLTHSSRLGEAHPDVAVVNCFDEPYSYALCPQSPEVREYAATLAAESVRDVACSSVVLEACGQLGLVHGGHHDKTAGAYDAETQRLLSICCCTHCRAAWQVAGLDPDGTVAALRAGEPTAEMLDIILQVRQAATDTLRHDVIGAVREAAAEPLDIVLHGHPDPWATGPNPGLTPTAADDADAVVAQCWPTDGSATETIRDLSTALDGKSLAGGYITVLPPASPERFDEHVAVLDAAGLQERHLYHLGLAGPNGYDLLRKAAR